MFAALRCGTVLCFLLDGLCRIHVRSEARPHRTQCMYFARLRIQVKVSADEDEVPDSVRSPTKMAKHKRLAMLAGDGGNADTDTDVGADEYEKPAHAEVSAMLMDAAAGAAEVRLQCRSSNIAAGLEHRLHGSCWFLLCCGSAARWIMVRVFRVGVQAVDETEARQLQAARAAANGDANSGVSSDDGSSGAKVAIVVHCCIQGQTE